MHPLYSALPKVTEATSNMGISIIVTDISVAAKSNALERCN